MLELKTQEAHFEQVPFENFDSGLIESEPREHLTFGSENLNDKYCSRNPKFLNCLNDPERKLNSVSDQLCSRKCSFGSERKFKSDLKRDETHHLRKTQKENQGSKQNALCISSH